MVEEEKGKGEEERLQQQVLAGVTLWKRTNWPLVHSPEEESAPTDLSPARGFSVHSDPVPNITHPWDSEDLLVR